MDPITALATITQLIGIYVAEKRGEGDLKRQDFQEWLSHHKHEELKELITNTHHLASEVNALLRMDHDNILKEIKTANSTLAKVMSRLDSLSHLTSVLAPDSQLSEFSMAALAHL